MQITSYQHLTNSMAYKSWFSKYRRKYLECVRQFNFYFFSRHLSSPLSLPFKAYNLLSANDSIGNKKEYWSFITFLKLKSFLFDFFKFFQIWSHKIKLRNLHSELKLNSYFKRFISQTARRFASNRKNYQRLDSSLPNYQNVSKKSILSKYAYNIPVTCNFSIKKIIF
jgi:hypothetical protein